MFFHQNNNTAGFWLWLRRNRRPSTPGLRKNNMVYCELWYKRPGCRLTATTDIKPAICELHQQISLCTGVSFRFELLLATMYVLVELYEDVKGVPKPKEHEESFPMIIIYEVLIKLIEPGVGRRCIKQRYAYSFQHNSALLSP